MTSQRVSDVLPVRGALDPPLPAGVPIMLGGCQWPSAVRASKARGASAYSGPRDTPRCLDDGSSVTCTLSRVRHVMVFCYATPTTILFQCAMQCHRLARLPWLLLPDGVPIAALWVGLLHAWWW